MERESTVYSQFIRTEASGKSNALVVDERSRILAEALDAKYIRLESPQLTEALVMALQPVSKRPEEA